MRPPINNPTSAPSVVERTEGVAGGSHQRMVSSRQCVTHHYACDCRENKLLQTLWPVCKDLLSEGQKGNDTAFAAYVDINEMWLEMYGVEILDDQRFQPTANDQADR